MMNRRYKTSAVKRILEGQKVVEILGFKKAL
jgi:hypothetical protein